MMKKFLLPKSTAIKEITIDFNKGELILIYCKTPKKTYSFFDFKEEELNKILSSIKDNEGLHFFSEFQNSIKKHSKPLNNN